LLSPKTVALAPSDTLALQAVLVFDDGSSREVSAESNWRSSNPIAVTVDGGGTVSAVATGTATITVNYQMFSATSTVTVSNAALQSLELTPATLSVPVGQTRALRLTGQFADGTTRDLTDRAAWTSSDARIALATGFIPGIVTGVSAGTATISASYMGRKATAAVTVP
jgi:trimeric autotransporter adhesin